MQTAEKDGRDFFAALAVREEAAENLVTAVFCEACTDATARGSDPSARCAGCSEVSCDRNKELKEPLR